MRILAIDDDTIGLVSTEAMLQAEGYEVVTCAGGLEAMTLLGGEAFDFILLDLWMPGMDGLAVTRWIRSQLALATLPILCQSAVESGIGREQAIGAGCTHWISKPYRRRELIAAVHETLRRHESGQLA